MNNSHYIFWEGLWFWWSGKGWSESNDGKRYPAVNIVILTKGSFTYALGRQTLTEPPPPDRDRVIVIKDMEQWESHWDQAAPYNKLLVYEFYEKNNSLCKAIEMDKPFEMDKPLEKLANRYKGKGNFCKLDVDNLEFLARLCGVEGGYPTFVLFKNGKQVGKVVGIKEDELERSIQRALN